MIFLAGLLYSGIIENVMIIVKVGLLKHWSEELQRVGLEQNVQIFYNLGSNDIDLLQV